MSDPTYRELVDSLEDAVFLHDPETGAFLDVNRRACELYGRTREELLAGGVNVVREDPLDVEEVRRRLLAAVEQGPQRFESRHRRGDGTTFLGEVTLTCVRLGNLVRVLAVVRGVTARRHEDDLVRTSEAALRESRTMLEKAQEVGRMGSWVSGLDDDRSLTWSRQTYRIFGVDESVPMDVDRFFSLVHEEDRAFVREAVERAVRERQAYAAEHRIVRPDGVVRWVHERADVATDASGSLRLIGVCQDITERRETEEQLRQMAKMEAVGRLAGGVAHDFNNMLTAIAGYADLALMQAPQESIRSNLMEIKTATTRAASLTRQLLTFGRRAVLQPRVIDLNAMVRELQPMLRRLLGEGVELVASLDGDLGHVRAAPDQVEQVLMNLVVNARDAMPRGGSLTIETRNVTIGPADEGGPGDPGAYVLLSVSDTGAGMDDAVLARCFEPFFTTKERGKGTGLGLSTVYAVVQEAGGRITARSAPNQGTTFRIYLPRTDAPAEPRVVEATLGSPPGGDETVLLVEDDDRVRDLTEQLLGIAGYAVLPACGADEALRRADVYEGRIHLLLTDVVMPQVGGRELYDRLVQRRPGVRVLFMSGYADDALVAHRISRGEHPFLQKPFTPEALLRAVRGAIDAGGAPAASPAARPAEPAGS